MSKNYLRDLNGLKSLMEKRAELRSLAFYSLTDGKFQTALIYSRKLLFTSQKIWKQFDDELRSQFEELFFFRTSKAKQHTQYLLDSALLCKIYLAAKKREQIKDVLDKIEFPHTKVTERSKLFEKNDKYLILQYNELKEIHARTSALFLTFIEIAKGEKLNNEAKKFYFQYTEYIKKYYSSLEYATSLFKFANFLYSIKQYRDAQKQFQNCLEIRKKNALNEGYVDVLINYSICLRSCGKIKEACEQTKVAIQIYRDSILKDRDSLTQYHLLLAKLQLQNGDFHQSYENFLVAYHDRLKLQKQHPKKIQIELNLMFFFQTLKTVEQKPEQVFTIKDRKQIDAKKKKAVEVIAKMKQTLLKRQDFAKYQDIESKAAHLNLVVSQSFFDLLSSEQVRELRSLLEKLSKYSFQKGISELMKTSFWEEPKIRQHLLQANPKIKNARGK